MLRQLDLADGDGVEAALKKVSESPAYQDFLKQRGFGLLYANGADFAAMFT